MNDTLVNLRPTRKGASIDSYTVHKSPGCGTARRFFRVDSELWTKSSTTRIDAEAHQILFGACKNCFKNANTLTDVWSAKFSGRAQLDPLKAKRLLAG